MRKVKKGILTLMCSALCMCTAFPAFAGEWKQEGGSWRYLHSDGTFGSDIWVDGIYYIGADGLMLTDAWTPDGFYVGSDGKWVPNYGEGSKEAELPGSTVQIYYKSRSIRISCSEDGSQTVTNDKPFNKPESGDTDILEIHIENGNMIVRRVNHTAPMGMVLEDPSPAPVGSYNGTCYEYKDEVRNGITLTYVTNEEIIREIRMYGNKENMEKGKCITIGKTIYSRY